jgi:hypothetical protein
VVGVPQDRERQFVAGRAVQGVQHLEAVCLACRLPVLHRPHTHLLVGQRHGTLPALASPYRRAWPCLLKAEVGWMPLGVARHPSLLGCDRRCQASRSWQPRWR